MAGLIRGKNDLATVRPDIAAQWHPDKNGDLSPMDVTYGSGKKVWWKCEKGHDYQSCICHRVNLNNGCPFCSGRKAIVGENDLATVRPDIAKQWHPDKNGNLTPMDVMEQSNKKVWWLCEKGHPFDAYISNRTGKHQGCPYCSGKKVMVGENDLATVRPDIAAQWHPDKNGKLTPQDVTVGSNKKVWWLCEKGHPWATTVNNRAIGNNGCPYCAGKKAILGENDLATLCPELAKEWHPTKNGKLKPSNVMPGSGRKVWWKCKYGHSWQASPNSRTTNKSGCPCCSGRQTIPGENDLATLCPEIAKEWHPTKNGKLKPSDVMPGSGIKAWWKCEYGHSWQMDVYYRTSTKNGCPHCASSHGEKAIQKILESLNVRFLHDKSIKGCRAKRALRHDFILLSDDEQILATIEYNGIQHYEPTPFHHATPEEAESEFQAICQRDNIKTKWLEKHGIAQLVIPYTEYNNLEPIVSGFVKEQYSISKKD